MAQTTPLTVINETENLRHIRGYIHDAQQFRTEGFDLDNTAHAAATKALAAHNAADANVHDAMTWAAWMLPGCTKEEQYQYIVSHLRLPFAERVNLANTLGVTY